MLVGLFILVLSFDILVVDFIRRILRSNLLRLTIGSLLVKQFLASGLILLFNTTELCHLVPDPLLFSSFFGLSDMRLTFQFVFDFHHDSSAFLPLGTHFDGLKTASLLSHVLKALLFSYCLLCMLLYFIGVCCGSSENGRLEQIKYPAHLIVGPTLTLGLHLFFAQWTFFLAKRG